MLNTLYTLRLAANLALACLSGSYQVYFAFNALSMAYTLVKTSQLTWLKFSKTFQVDFGAVHRGTTVQFNYHCLLLPFKDERECAMCTEQERQIDGVAHRVDAYFCKNHAYHTACLMDWIHQKSRTFIEGNFFNFTDHYQNGIYTGRTTVISIPEGNLPNCPECRDYPHHAFLSANVQGCYSASVSIKDPTPKMTAWSSNFVEQLNAAYSLGQSSLSALMHIRSELIVHILAMQNIMIISDLAALIRDCVALSERVSCSQIAQEEKSKLLFRSFAFAMAAGIFVVGLNRYFSWASSLKDILARQLPLGETGKMAIYWGRPWLQMFSQWIYLARIGANLAYAHLSPDPLLKRITALFQLVSFLYISKLPWIRVDRTIAEHVPYGMTEAKVTFYFLPSADIASIPQKLQEALGAIYQYTSAFFKDSVWNGFWKTSNYTTKLVYDVVIKNKVVEGAVPYLAQASGEAYSWYHKTWAELTFLGL